MAIKFELTRKFFNICQETYISMEEYINNILMTVQKLADIDEQIEDKWISFVMRNGINGVRELRRSIEPTIEGRIQIRRCENCSVRRK